MTLPSLKLVFMLLPSTKITLELKNANLELSLLEQTPHNFTQVKVRRPGPRKKLFTKWSSRTSLNIS